MQPKLHLFALSLLLGSCVSLLAGEGRESYQYDPTGRISHIEDPNGTVTRFEYDALGNLLSVRTTAGKNPPLITEAHPTELRAGETYQLEVQGENLSAAEVTPPTPHFTTSALIALPDSLSFVLSLSADAPVGEHLLRVINPDGAASIPILVLAALPRLRAGPLPLALPEDGSVQAILLTLSHADLVDRTVRLSTAEPAIAQVIDSSVLITSGDTRARARIRGTAPGVTTLSLESDGLDSAQYSVYVTAAYGDINTKFSDTLGLLVAEVDPPDTQAERSRHSPLLGLARGPLIQGIDPPALSVGTTGAQVTIQGMGLHDLQGIAFVPAAGVSAQGLDVGADGASATISVDVNAEAPLGPRRIVLAGPADSYPPASPGGDSLSITLPPPQIESIDPLFARPGDTAQQLLIRGRYLNQPVAAIIEPGQGLTVGTHPETNGNGTRLYARFSVAADALPGERAVIVVTQGGSSSALSSAANRFTIADGTLQTNTPLTSPLLGVQVGSREPAAGFEKTLAASNLGVSVGPVVSDIRPIQGAIGTDLEMELHGSALADVDQVLVVPPDGISIEGVVPDPAGDLVRVHMQIDPDAPRTLRRVRVLAAGAQVPFSSPAGGRFLVTAELAQLASVSPNTLQIGAGELSVQLRGTSFSGATKVSARPPDDLVLARPSVNDDGTALTFSVRAESEASPGPRVLQVSTPAGTSTASASPQNTLTLFRDTQGSAQPLVGTLVGVSVGVPQDPDFTFRELPAPVLGLQVGQSDLPPKPSGLASARPTGLAVGPVITAVQTPPLALGGSYQVRVLGHNLHDVDGAGVFPALGVTASSPFPSLEGREVLFSLTVAPDADLRPRELRLVAGPLIVPFADPADALVRLGTGLPLIDSIHPILTQPGDTLELLVRGHELQGATEVLADPPEGLVFDHRPIVNAQGTELRARVHVMEDAPIGPRVIRVQTPGGGSTDQSSPANTFTIY